MSRFQRLIKFPIKILLICIILKIFHNRILEIMHTQKLKSNFNKFYNKEKQYILHRRSLHNKQITENLSLKPEIINNSKQCKEFNSKILNDLQPLLKMMNNKISKKSIEKIRLKTDNNYQETLSENQVNVDEFKFIEENKEINREHQETKMPLDIHKNFIIVNPNYCTIDLKDLYVLHIILSKSSDFNFRSEIRTCWKGLRWTHLMNYKIIFFLGFSESKYVNDQIMMESDQYGDIVQAAVPEIQTVQITFYFMSWTQKFCNRANWIVRSEANMFINMFQLIR